MERDWAVIVKRQRAASTRNYGSKINRTKRNQVALSVISSGNVGKRMLRVASLQANINHYIFFFCSFLLLLLHRNTLTYLQMAHEINSVQAKYFQWFLMVWDEQEKRNMKYVFSIINKLVAVLEIMYTIKKKQKRNTHTTFSAVPVMIDKKKTEDSTRPHTGNIVNHSRQSCIQTTCKWIHGRWQANNSSRWPMIRMRKMAKYSQSRKKSIHGWRLLALCRTFLLFMQTFSNRTDLFVRALSVAGGMSGRIGQAK